MRRLTEAGISTTMAQLGPPAAGQSTSSAAAGLLDEAWRAEYKSGYVFIYTSTQFDARTNQWNGFTLHGKPAAFGQTGGVYYCMDQSFVIHANSTTTAGSTDMPIGD